MARLKWGLYPIYLIRNDLCFVQKFARIEKQIY